MDIWQNAWEFTGLPLTQANGEAEWLSGGYTQPRGHFLQCSLKNKFIKTRTKTLGKFKLDSSTAVWPWWAHSREISLLRTGDSEWQVSQRAVWNSLLGSKYHVYQSCQHPLPSFAHLQMTSSWIWFPSLSLSLDKQGRKGVIYCIYLCIYLFIWHTARKSIPPLPSWQGFREGAGGCVGAEAPEWLHTTPRLFPGTEKRFSQHWVSILLCWKKQSRACSL